MTKNTSKETKNTREDYVLSPNVVVYVNSVVYTLGNNRRVATLSYDLLYSRSSGGI